MRATRLTVTLAAAAGASVLAAGCGGSSSKAEALPTATLTASPTATVSVPPVTEVGGKLGFSGESICTTVPKSLAEDAIGQSVVNGKAKEPKPGTHACSWISKDGHRAVVAVIFDSSLDRVNRHPLAFVNGVAGTDFTTTFVTGNDTGARYVNAYGLVDDSSIVKTAGLAKIANTVNDFIVDQDAAAGQD